MAEFVERELEQLLPTFEQLKLTQLMSASELNDFIGQSRAFEYKCAKRTKRAKDFLAYAHYMANQLDAIGQRRRQLKYVHRYDEIERPLKHKCAFVLRICAHRFRKVEYHREEIAFLRRANMFRQCSQAYTRLLQIHGHQASNHEEAARFEFFNNNHSADSARAILAVALRKFPAELQLWLTHFEIELRYVEFLHQRRHFLLHNKHPKNGKGVQTNEKPEQYGKTDNIHPHYPNEDVYDDVLDLKLARIVYELAMKNVEDPAEKIKLLHAFLRVARDCGDFADTLLQNLKEHLQTLGDEHTEEANCDEDDHQQLVSDQELFAIDTEGDQQDDDGSGFGGDAGDQRDRNAIRPMPPLLECITKATKTKEHSSDEEDNDTRCKKIHNDCPIISVLDGFDPDDPELKQLLSNATLTDDYDQRPLEDVLLLSARQQKKQRKAERAGNAGPSWHSMPTVELTDERRRDLEVVQMRDALDPAQHYRKPDREVLPKYFQVGRIIESKADFYSGRVPKRLRKRTMVEELMSDTELLARNKRRFTTIIRRREATTRGAFQRHGALPKWSKRKNAKKNS